MKKIYTVLFLYLGIFLMPGQALCETIMVGGYPFPPFVESEKGQPRGITLDLIDELNKFQDKYRFKFFLTSSKRRYGDFDSGRYDVIFFEDKNWGWKDKPVSASKVFLKGGEVYITKADPEKDQTYFDCLKKKSLTVIMGYHYGFADFNADEAYLRKNFNIEFNSFHEGNILKVLGGRSDITVVTISFLNKFFKDNPDKKDKFLLSKKLDQEYNHTILVRDHFKIDTSTINSLLDKMSDKKILNQLWANYGIE